MSTLKNCLILGFLELINNMLTSGTVPALYNDEEKEQVIGQVCKQNCFFYLLVTYVYLSFFKS